MNILTNLRSNLILFQKLMKYYANDVIKASYIKKNVHVKIISSIISCTNQYNTFSNDIKFEFFNLIMSASKITKFSPSFIKDIFQTIAHEKTVEITTCFFKIINKRADSFDQNYANNIDFYINLCLKTSKSSNYKLRLNISEFLSKIILTNFKQNNKKSIVELMQRISPTLLKNLSTETLATILYVLKNIINFINNICIQLLLQTDHCYHENHIIYLFKTLFDALENENKQFLLVQRLVYFLSTNFENSNYLFILLEILAIYLGKISSSFFLFNKCQQTSNLPQINPDNSTSSNGLDLIDTLYDLLYHTNDRLVLNTAWCFRLCCRHNPSRIYSYLSQLLLIQECDRFVNPCAIALAISFCFIASQETRQGLPNLTILSILKKSLKRMTENFHSDSFGSFLILYSLSSVHFYAKHLIYELIDYYELYIRPPFPYDSSKIIILLPKVTQFFSFIINISRNCPECLNQSIKKRIIFLIEHSTHFLLTIRNTFPVFDSTVPFSVIDFLSLYFDILNILPLKIFTPKLTSFLLPLLTCILSSYDYFHGVKRDSYETEYYLNEDHLLLENGFNRCCSSEIDFRRVLEFMIPAPNKWELHESNMPTIRLLDSASLIFSSLLSEMNRLDSFDIILQLAENNVEEIISEKYLLNISRVTTSYLNLYSTDINIIMDITKIWTFLIIIFKSSQTLMSYELSHYISELLVAVAKTYPDLLPLLIDYLYSLCINGKNEICINNSIFYLANLSRALPLKSLYLKHIVPLVLSYCACGKSKKSQTTAFLGLSIILEITNLETIQEYFYDIVNVLNQLAFNNSLLDSYIHLDVARCVNNILLAHNHTFLTKFPAILKGLEIILYLLLSHRDTHVLMLIFKCMENMNCIRRYVHSDSCILSENNKYYFLYKTLKITEDRNLKISCLEFLKSVFSHDHILTESIICPHKNNHKFDICSLIFGMAVKENYIQDISHYISLINAVIKNKTEINFVQKFLDFSCSHIFSDSVMILDTFQAKSADTQNIFASDVIEFREKSTSSIIFVLKLVSILIDVDHLELNVSPNFIDKICRISFQCLIIFNHEIQEISFNLIKKITEKYYSVADKSLCNCLILEQYQILMYSSLQQILSSEYSTPDFLASSYEILGSWIFYGVTKDPKRIETTTAIVLSQLDELTKNLNKLSVIYNEHTYLITFMALVKLSSHIFLIDDQIILNFNEKIFSIWKKCIDNYLFLLPEPFIYFNSSASFLSYVNFSTDYNHNIIVFERNMPSIIYSFIKYLIFQRPYFADFDKNVKDPLFESFLKVLKFSFPLISNDYVDIYVYLVALITTINLQKFHMRTNHDLIIYLLIIDCIVPYFKKLILLKSSFLIDEIIKSIYAIHISAVDIILRETIIGVIVNNTY
ncbi:hypothetical protein HZS_1938 [Henneguya salminicola]|nr:hypothetical protein HZS_1938 [Henneguya salminicola]